MNEKLFLKLIVIVVILMGTLYWYSTRYITVRIATDEVLFYNPFEIDEKGFEEEYKKAILLQTKGDFSKAKKHFQKALFYRNSYNEKIRKREFSCGNDFWKNEQNQLLMYSSCYSDLSMPDSAMNCLRPALYNIEKYHFSTESRFFELAIEKYGTQEEKNQLAIALKNIQPLDCFMCNEFFFTFKGFKS